MPERATNFHFPSHRFPNIPENKISSLYLYLILKTARGRNAAWKDKKAKFNFLLFSSPKGNWRWERKKRREGGGNN